MWFLCFSSDKTVSERNLPDLRADLNERLGKGEAELTIKFFNGTPKIVQVKNNEYTLPGNPIVYLLSKCKWAQNQVLQILLSTCTFNIVILIETNLTTDFFG